MSMQGPSGGGRRFRAGPRRFRGGLMSDINVTPMVDVTFLLLIFFMVTAAFSMQNDPQIAPKNPETIHFSGESDQVVPVAP